MPNTKELRRRIRSVKNMSQITKAMQMVAATKMRRAQTQAISGRPYTTTLHKAVMALLPKLSKITNPLLVPNNSEVSAALVISTDKGLCGSLNTNLFKAVSTFINENKDPQFYTIGKKGRNFIAKMGKDLVADFENSDLVTFRTASQIGRLVTKAYLNNEIGSFSIIYPNFVSALRQEPKIMPLLPINLESMQEFYDMALKDTEAKKETLREEEKQEFLFEPNLSELLDFIVTHYVQVKIYQALLETKASEHSARMIAMQNATDNAKELAGDLTLSYNQTRQESITKELLEITSALAALE